jgi:magnesium-transporting ATPase (P-type)
MYEQNDLQNDPQNVNTLLPSSTLAIVSLVAGILGFTLFPFIASIVAIWTGYEARKETRSVPPKASGDGMATAGIIMGWIQIGLTVVSICCVAIYFIVMVGWIGSEALQ